MVNMQLFDFAVPAAISMAQTAHADTKSGDPHDKKIRHATAPSTAEIFARFCKQSNRWLSHCIVPRQAHGKKIKRITSRNVSSKLQGVDGLITQDSTVALAITVADCVPIFLSVPSRNVVGILHSGRKSTGILQRAITLINRIYRVHSADIHLLFGPSIQSCCYEVDQEIALQFQKKWGTESMLMQKERFYLDLHAANLKIARTLGVYRIQTIPQCTCCNPQYHSYRREGVERYRKMLALIALR